MINFLKRKVLPMTSKKRKRMGQEKREYQTRKEGPKKINEKYFREKK